MSLLSEGAAAGRLATLLENSRAGCRRRLAALALLLGVPASVAAACEPHPRQRINECRNPCEEPTCLDFRHCGADLDCAIGTVCTNGVCRPPRKIDAASNALVKGLSCDALELNRGERGMFSIEAPKAAVNVSCGLFIGPPTFTDGAIRNVSASVVRYHVFPLDPTRTTASVLNLRLDDLEPLPPAENCQVESALKGITPLVESLRLGCWAMSLDGVVAASRLVPLDPSELPEYGLTPLRSCEQSASATDGSYCVLPPQIGTCNDHECKPITGGAGGGGGSGAVLRNSCAMAENGMACQLGSPGRGRCYAGTCLDQSVQPPLVSGSCAEETSTWSNCFPSPLGLFGTCFNGLCRQRCHDQDDCNQGEHCQRPPAQSYLGVCRGAMEQSQ